jgi:hypothetical protein
LPGAETYLSRPPSQEIEAAVETVLTTGHGRLIFGCENAVGCLTKWILDYETACFDFGIGGYGARKVDAVSNIPPDKKNDLDPIVGIALAGDDNRIRAVANLLRLP